MPRYVYYMFLLQSLNNIKKNNKIQNKNVSTKLNNKNYYKTNRYILVIKPC